MKLKLVYIFAQMALLPVAALALDTAPFSKTDTVPAFGDGEQLTYAVSYRAAMVPNVKVAEVKFKTTAEKTGGEPVYHVSANGKVHSGFKWFFNLDDTYETWMDTGSLRPVKFAAKLREGDYKFDMNYTYSWDRMEVYTAWRNHKKPKASHKTMQLTEDSFDPIALFFNLRASDVSALQKGEAHKIRIVLEDTIRTIRYKYLGREERNISGMGRYKTLKFSCELVSSSGESFKDGSEFFIWISDDKNKIPLYLESPIRVGTIRVTVSGYSNLKNPLTSKIK